MNKAFVKEQEDAGPARCPRCQALGQAVGPTTLAAQLPEECRGAIADHAFFCPFPRCDVVYFDAYERVVLVSQLPQAVYPKSPNAPLCGCFGLTLDDIDQDIAEGAPTRCRELLAKARGPLARCSVAAVNGQPCIAEMQRYYIRRSAGKPG